MSCTKTTTKCSIGNDCCKEHIKDVVIYAANLFDEFKIDYWIDFNLLLGFYEKKRYIDRNVLSVKMGDIEKISQLEYRIFEDGFYFTKCVEDNCSKLKIHYSRKNLLCVEIIGWEIDRGNLFKRFDDSIDKKTKFKKDFIEPLGKIEYNGVMLSCVNNIDKFYNIRK